jgi:ABC-2 type transport system permease protein
MKNLKIWGLFTSYSFQQVLTNRPLMVVFLSGKIIRIVMFFVFLTLIFRGPVNVFGYSGDQILLFYLSFNLIDTTTQLLFREVYRFRPLVISGNFDFVLAKPISPLIRVLLGGADVMDLIILCLLVIFTAWFGFTHITANIFFWLLYLALFVNAVLLSAAFHIFVLGLGIITLSVDHLVMIYRDLTSMLRIPVDVYTEPLRSLITFVLPLGIMFTFPPKALLGLLSWQMILISFLLSVFYLYLSVQVWRYSLHHYQSASS